MPGGYDKMAGAECRPVRRSRSHLARSCREDLSPLDASSYQRHRLCGSRQGDRPGTLDPSSTIRITRRGPARSVRASRRSTARSRYFLIVRPGKGLACGFQASENGPRAPRAWPCLDAGERDASVRWMARRAWIGSRLTARGKHRIGSANTMNRPHHGVMVFLLAVLAWAIAEPAASMAAEDREASNPPD